MSENPFLVKTEPAPSQNWLLYPLLLGLAAVAAFCLYWNSSARRYPTSELLRLEQKLLLPHVTDGKVALPAKEATRQGRVLLVIPSIWSDDKTPHVHPDFYALSDKLQAPTASEAETVMFCRNYTMPWQDRYQRKGSTPGAGDMRTLVIQLRATEVYVFANNGGYLGCTARSEAPPHEVAVKSDGQTSDGGEGKEFVKAWVRSLTDTKGR